MPCIVQKRTDERERIFREASKWKECLPPGAELMTTALAEAIGVPYNNLTPCLEAAAREGLIYRRQRDTHVRSPMWWSLTDHSSGAPPPKRQTVYVPEQNTPQEGANRVQHVLKAEPAGADATDREARSKVMALEGSDSPTGRGTSGAPAVSAAPVFHSPLLRTPGRVSCHGSGGSKVNMRITSLCTKPQQFPSFGDASGTPFENAGGQA